MMIMIITTTTTTTTTTNNNNDNNNIGTCIKRPLAGSKGAIYKFYKKIKTKVKVKI